MKRFVLVAVIVGILALALASTAFAQGPVQGALAGTQPGLHTPGTGMMQQPGMGYGLRGPAGAMAERRGGMAWAGQPDAVGALLGMTEAQIQAERQDGKSLAQIAAEKGKSKETLVSTILSAKKAILDGQVSAGSLSQAQADAMYANMQQRVTVMVDRTDVGPGCGGALGQTSGLTMGRGGMGGRWNR